MYTDMPVVFRSSDFVAPQVDLTECPECFAVVRLASINDHMEKVHGS